MRRTIIKIWFAVVLLAIGYANVSFAQSKEPVELLDGNREKNKSPQGEIRLNPFFALGSKKCSKDPHILSYRNFNKLKSDPPAFLRKQEGGDCDRHQSDATQPFWKKGCPKEDSARAKRVPIWSRKKYISSRWGNMDKNVRGYPASMKLGRSVRTYFSNEKYGLNKNYLKDYVLDTKSILTSPSGWGKSDWIRASLIVGITVGLYTYDQEIQNWMLKNRDNTTDEIAKFAQLFGDGGYTIPSLGVVYLYGHFFENEKARRTVLLSLESFVVSGIFTQAIKFSGHRHRPNTGDPYNTWDGPSFSTTHLSFPSGHSSSAFAIATVIASEYDDNVFIPPLAYSIATLTALSRVNDNAHWASDVFFGSVIGYFTATAIVGLHSNKKDGSLVAFPITDGRHTALLTSYKF